MLEFIIMGLITMAAMGLYVWIMIRKKMKSESQPITFTCDHCNERNCDCSRDDSG